MPILSGRIGKWILALSEFDLCYELAKAVKGQVLWKLFLGLSSLMDPRVTGGRNRHSTNLPSGKEV